jgi:hypothetical protein
MRELPQQGEIPTVRVGVRGNPEPAHLPMLAGIEATLRLLDGEEIAASDNRPPTPAPRGSAMATADSDGEHVRLDIDVSGTHASLRLDPLLALRRGGEVLEAVGLVMRPVLTRLRRATR